MVKYVVFFLFAKQEIIKKYCIKLISLFLSDLTCLLKNKSLLTEKNFKGIYRIISKYNIFPVKWMVFFSLFRNFLFVLCVLLYIYKFLILIKIYFLDCDKKLTISNVKSNDIELDKLIFLVGTLKERIKIDCILYLGSLPVTNIRLFESVLFVLEM